MNCERCRPKRKNLEQLSAEADNWNARNPIGSSVKVVNDRGGTFFTITTSEAWVMGGHSVMVKLRGISGGYLLDRVTAI